MSDKKTESWYLAELLLSGLSSEQIEHWLRDNPPPKTWTDNGFGPYAWAYTEMAVIL